METISYKIFTKYLQQLSKSVESKINERLPDKLCLVFEGWNSQTTHFIAVRKTYNADTKYGYKCAPLRFVPF